MAYTNFAYPDVLQRLKLTQLDQSLFDHITDHPIDAMHRTWLQRGELLAIANGTEKARSEFLIAQVLLLLQLQIETPFGIYSGQDFSVDPAKDLNGVCDFILSRGPQSTFLQPPILAIAEAKNAAIREGFGQCIAAMVAAQQVNQTSAKSSGVIYGCVSTGTEWKFLQLAGNVVTLDLAQYYIDNPGKILGILAWIIQHG